MLDKSIAWQSLGDGSGQQERLVEFLLLITSKKRAVITEARAVSQGGRSPL